MILDQLPEENNNNNNESSVIMKTTVNIQITRGNIKYDSKRQKELRTLISSTSINYKEKVSVY